MSSGMNKWTGAGNLTEDPTLRYTQSGTAVLNMRVACNERYKDRDGEWKDRAEFVTVVVWDKRGEALAKFLAKGSFVVVEGKLRTSSYEKDGQKRWSTEVVARDVILPPKGGGGGGQRSGGGGGGSASLPPHMQDAADAFGDGSEDIPF